MAAGAAFTRFLADLSPPLLRRSYQTAATAAAAVPQFDYDHYYDYEVNESSERANRIMATPLTDTEGSCPLKRVHWVFIGSPSAKKHIYAEMLSKVLDVPHITISSLVRQDLSPRSFLYQRIADAVNQGKLVPESIIFGLLSKRLDDGYYRGETGFILDGIPRTRLQAEILDELADVDLVVNFRCPESCFHGDTVLSHSQTSYHRSKSTNTSLKMASEDAQPKFFTSCSDQVKFLEDYYRNQEKLIDFQVRGAPRETWKGLLAALHLQHITAVLSSRISSMSSRKT